MKCAKGFMMCSIDSDRTLFDIPSGPDCRLFSLSIVSVANTSVKGAIKKLLGCGCFKYSQNFVRDFCNFSARFLPTE